LPLEKIAQVALPEVVEGIKRVREGNLIIDPGFDGQYGTVKFLVRKKRKQINKVVYFRLTN